MMRFRIRQFQWVIGVCIWLSARGGIAQQAEPKVDFKRRDGELEIMIAGSHFATYIHDDDVIRRPYFAHVHAPSGVQVTRNHPPIEGQDSDDHATMHPGIWLAFGDIDGFDFWRNRARVVHAGYVTQPEGGPGRGTFAVRNRYQTPDGKRTVCDEIARITIAVRPGGYLLIYDAIFSSNDGDFVFGDQEEMGLGVRVATPLTVENGGRILNADGLIGEGQAWGKRSRWCDYSGFIGGERVGVALLPDPSNFRGSWFHARDYGLLVANPFGRNAFTRGEKSRVLVEKTNRFRVRFGILIHDDISGSEEIETIYEDFLEQIDTDAP